MSGERSDYKASVGNVDNEIEAKGKTELMEI